MYIALFIAAFCGYVATQSTGAITDTVLPGGGRKVQVSGKNQGLYALTKYGQVLQLVYGAWQAISMNNAPGAAPYKASYIAAWFRPSDGLYGVNAIASDYGHGGDAGSPAQNYLYWNTVAKAWGTAALYGYTVSNIDALMVTRSSCLTQACSPGACAVVNQPGANCNNFQAASGDNGAWWRIDFNNNLYSSTSGASWTQQTSPPAAAGYSLTYVDVQAANRVVVGDSHDQVHYWDGSSWTLVAGASLGYGCNYPTINNVAIYCIDTYGEVHQLSGLF